MYLYWFGCCSDSLSLPKQFFHSLTNLLTCHVKGCSVKCILSALMGKSRFEVTWQSLQFLLLKLTISVTLDLAFGLSEPQCPHLWNGGNTSPTSLLWGFNKHICEKRSQQTSKMTGDDTLMLEDMSAPFLAY